MTQPSRRVRLGLWVVLLLVGLVARGVQAQEEPEGSTPEAESSPAPKEAATAATKDEATTKDAEERNTPSTREITFAGGEGGTVIIVEVEDVIDLGLAPYMRRVIEAAGERDDVLAIISDIDTPGGRVDAAVQIRDALLESKVPTIAWVHTQAISAGALIAYAHDYIVVAEGGSMGAATPIQMGGGGQAEPVEEKMTSYMRSTMRATAEAKDRDGDVAEAMVDRTIVVPGVSVEGKLLTASKRQLLRYGIADAQADDLDALLSVMKLEGAKVERPSISWAEKIARFLTNPIVSSLLMSLGMLGLLIELYQPGFGIPGIVGICCLLLFFGGHLVVELAGLEELLLFLGGLVLLGLEIFVTPGFGVLGALGVAALITSLVLALVGLPIDVSLDTGAIMVALGRVSLAGITTAVFGVLFLKLFPRTGPGRKLVLSVVAAEGGPQTLKTPLGSAARDRPRDRAAGAVLVGTRGVALTDLRPAGRGRFGAERLDVVTQGDYLESGAALVVLEATPLRVVVGPAPAAAEEKD